jgi:hydrogenase nickel incorporation protein HypA/HybF
MVSNAMGPRFLAVCRAQLEPRKHSRQIDATPARRGHGPLPRHDRVESMHERSLIRALLRQVRQLQTEHGATRVVAVRVSVGEFSGVEAELVSRAFEELVHDSPIRGARLELREIPLAARCQFCSCEFAVVNFQFKCPRCHGSHVSIVSGDGLVLESVTLE